MLIALTGCVSMKKYKSLESAKADAEKKLKAQTEECKIESENRLKRIVELEGHVANLDNEKGKLVDSISKINHQLEENEAYLKSLGDKLDEQKKRLAAEIESKNKILEQRQIELNAALANIEKERQNVMMIKEELEKTSARVRLLEAELKRKDSAVMALRESVIKALSGFDKLDITVEKRNGKVYVSMAEKLLFKSGSILVDPKGKDALLKLAQALNKQKDVTINIEGHTDNKNISTEKIKDNWDLSVLRATSIVRLLTVDGKIDEKRIIASGRGESQPVQSNASPEGRAQNRRTEIILTPNLDKLLDILNN